jgi:hypothetical protein
MEVGKRRKLGTWEVGQLFFVAGVIFFMEDGKRGKPGRFAAILTRISKNLKKPDRFLNFQ